MKTKKLLLPLILCLAFSFEVSSQIPPTAPPTYLVNEPVDISGDFRDFSNTYYLADSLVSFDPATGTGTIIYRRYEYSSRQAFNNILGILRPVRPNEFPEREYAASPVLPFSIEFISPRSFRIKASTGLQAAPEEESLMLVNGKPSKDNSWKYSKINGGYKYTGSHGAVVVRQNPWRIEIYNSKGNLVTRTTHRV